MTENEGYHGKVKALLLAAGLGTRLQPLTQRVPKCLVSIHGRPLLDYWFALLCETPIRDVLINTHHLRDQVVRYLDQLQPKGRFVLRESYEPHLLGSAGTIAANRDWMDDADACLVIYADNLSTVNLDALLHYHQSHSDPFTMMLFHSPSPRDCGIAQLDDQSRIVDFIEKPLDPPSDTANAGVYVMSADVYRKIADRQTFDIGHDILPALVGRMRGWLYNGYHRDIGCLESLELARREKSAVFRRFA